MMSRKDDFTVFCEKFQPISDNTSVGEDTQLFETYGTDLERVQNTPINHIWTVIDCDGKLYISAGYHRVNRMNYMITQIPWQDGQRDYRY